jgi:ribosomal protein S10
VLQAFHYCEKSKKHLHSSEHKAGERMNKRIQELAHEVGLPTYNPEGIPTKLEKFAELIVKECVTVLNNRFMGDMNREDLEVRRCVADLKEHFGVKE